MDLSKSFQSQDPEHERVLEEFNHCCLCGKQLNFLHKVDYLELKVKEDARCPSCQVQLRVKEHTLH